MYRIVQNDLKKLVKNLDRILLVTGARQVGKTTLLKNNFPNAWFVNIEKGEYTDGFKSRNTEEIKNLFKRKNNPEILVLDEVQRLDNPGLIAKVIHDEIGEIKLILSGSSSLEIANKMAESLAGRKINMFLFPLTLQEKLIQKGILKKPKSHNFSLNITNLPNKTSYKAEILSSLQYGMYPETINNKIDPEQYLSELCESNLLKDVYYLNLVKNTKNLQSLLKLLAYQIGCQVNINDLANRVGIARETVMDYIEIFKKLFIIFSLPPFTRKRRDEIGKTEKIYFFDTGLRNAIINDFSPAEYRPDFGNIFENFVISELWKLNTYYSWRYNFYYWRTKWGSEVDLVMAKDQQIKAFEIKTNTGVITRAFTDTYKEAETAVLTLKNIESILL